MSFTVLIPARLASTRLPNKPLADLEGRPMIVRVAQRAAQSGASQVVVASDSQEVLAACAAHGVQAVLTARTMSQAATAWPRPASSWAWTGRMWWSMCKVTSR